MKTEKEPITKPERKPCPGYCDNVNSFTGKCKDCGCLVLTITIPGMTVKDVLNLLPSEEQKSGP